MNFQDQQYHELLMVSKCRFALMMDWKLQEDIISLSEEMDFDIYGVLCGFFVVVVCFLAFFFFRQLTKLLSLSAAML